jgi:hypothetical protein
MPLLPDRRGDLACGDGCGLWISASELVLLVGTTELSAIAQPIAHWKATPFRAARCPTCDTALDDHYMPLPDGSVLTLGYCATHGAWLDHGSRDDFIAAHPDRYDGPPIAPRRRTPPPTKPAIPFCGKCGKPMEPGFVPDETDGRTALLMWRAGAPQDSFWKGIRPDDAHTKREPIPIQVFRCTMCGFLEAYARSAT